MAESPNPTKILFDTFCDKASPLIKVGAALIPGASQGAAITFTGHPLDVIKTRLQSGQFGSTTLQCASRSIKQEGITSLYRGVSTPLMSHMSKRSYQFWLFRHLYEKHEINPYILGTFTGSTGSLLGTPLQVIKVNTQISTKNTHKNAWDFTKKHFKNTGVRGFYTGFGINAAKDGVFGGVFLGNYINLKKIIRTEFLLPYLPSSIIDYFEEENSKHINNFIAGGLAHSITWGLFIPIDYVKTNVQRGITTGKKQTALQVIKKSSIRTMYRGVAPALLRIFPVSGVGMTVYEIVYQSMAPYRTDEWKKKD